MPPKKGKKAELVDWYKKIPERFLLKTHNPHFETHHIKLPFRMIICGSSGSGKTQTLMSLIYNMPDTFENIYICAKNKDEPLYNFIEEKLGKKGLKITEIDKDGLPDLDKLNKEEQTLIVMDDLVGEKNQKPMEQYFLRARKKNASLVYITQSYYAVPKMIRNNMTYLIIKQISSMKNLTMIAREFDLGLPKETLTNMYKDATKEKQNFLMMDLEAPPRDRFRKGFNDIYEIEGEEEE
jgi:ABC-type dipeptide/oligopeptide/nickel transport system ATPase component